MIWESVFLYVSLSAIITTLVQCLYSLNNIFPKTLGNCMGYFGHPLQNDLPSSCIFLICHSICLFVCSFQQGLMQILSSISLRSVSRNSEPHFIDNR